MNIARLAATLASTSIGLAVLAAAPTPVLAADPAAGPPAGGGDSAQAAATVSSEDRRLTQVRTVSSLARWQGETYETPYRMSTGNGYTLVLTRRAEPYTVDDLLALAPQTFVKLSDGTYLLSEHVVVLPKAVLRLARPGGITIRLASSSKGFATLVSLGGRMEVVGEKGAPVRLSSWDLDAGAVDRHLDDGRAYVRAVGGQFSSDYLEASDLGFWSGRTGGIALTGTDRPNTGALERVDAKKPATKGAPSILEGVSTQPAGPLQSGQTNPNLNYAVPALDYVSSSLANTRVARNAFGLFVSGANGLQINDSAFNDNLIAGVVLHRFVRNGVISSSEANGNAGDGFSLERATTSITLSEVTANGNAENGVQMSGRPLSEGPSATGSTTTSYGGNSVSGSSFADNGSYGIQVLGGFNIGVQNNRVSGSDMGIVVTGPADRIAVTGNEVRRSDRHGIALVEGVSASTVTGNVVEAAETGVYLRGSSAQVRGNTIEGARSHGLSLVGAVSGTEVTYNVLAGSGDSALDSRRSDGAFTTNGNRDDGWEDTSPWYLVFKKLLQPMTGLWASIALLTILSAVRSRSRRRSDDVLHPYAHQMAHRQGPRPEEPAVLDLRDGEPTGAGAR